jgi:tripartite-type tricarboxylate transporter receptor subunit TctC
MMKWPFTLVVTFIFATISSVTAQVYPSRPVTMIVPYPAGGAFDTVARAVADRMKTSLGQPLILENVGGANGSIGTGRAARASPDGYTIVLGYWGTHVTNAVVYNLQYDVQKDFEPISLVGTNPLVIVSKNALPANDLRELVVWLKANPDKAAFATIGPGSPAHIAGVFFQKLTGTRFQYVPYRGGAPVMQDLVAGQVDLSIVQAAVVVPQLRAGRVKAHAVTAEGRLGSAPDIPAADEAGVPGLHIETWSGLWAPKGTPGDVVMRLNAAVVDALADPAVRQRLADIGQEIFAREQQTPGALAAFQKAEIEKWWPIIKAAGIRAE